MALTINPARWFGKDSGKHTTNLPGYSNGASAAALLSSAVWACVQRITARAANGKFGVYRWNNDNGDYVHVPGHDLNRVLRSPSPRHSTFTFWRTVSEHVLVNGNAYVLIGGRNEREETPPRYLIIADPGSVTIEEVEEPNNRGGRINNVYYHLTIPRIGGSPGSRRYFPSDVAHVKGANFNILTGHSPSPAACALASAIRLMNESSSSAEELARNSKRFGGVLESRIDGGAQVAEDSGYIEQLKSDIDSLGAGSIPITPHGLILKPWNSTPADGQLAQNMNWAVQEIARVMGVPLAMIQHTQGVRPEINQMEDAIQRDAVIPLMDSIAGALTYAGLTTDERVRGYVVMAKGIRGYPSQFGMADMAMRWGQTGAVQINELRRMLGLEPIEGGDVLPQTAGAGNRDPSPEEDQEDEPAEEDE